MATKTSICNRALMNLRVDLPMTDVDVDDSFEAGVFSAIWDEILEEVLERRSWVFANKQTPLVESALAAPPDWAIRYVYPPDCVIPRELLVSTRVKGSPPLDFGVEVGDSGELFILTDDAVDAVRYTARVSDPNQWGATFVTALSWRLAAEAAAGLKQDLELGRFAMQMYERALSSAAKVNVISGRHSTRVKPPSVTARG